MAGNSEMTDAVVLFGHGSRDPQWRAAIDAVAERIVRREPGLSVRCAFLELAQPDLATAVSELVAIGKIQITIVPMFLGAGRHAREDLPLLVEGLRREHPKLRLQLLPTVGEHPLVLDLLATIAVPKAGSND